MKGLRLRKLNEARGAHVDLTTGLDIERIRFAALFATDDQTIGMNAFIAKERPEFTGN